MDYINLANIDLAKFDGPETRKDLAREFFKAMTEDGFLTVSGHRISEETWDMQMDLAYATMTMGPKEKVPYEGNNSYEIQYQRHAISLTIPQSQRKKTSREYMSGLRWLRGWDSTRKSVYRQSYGPCSLPGC